MKNNDNTPFSGITEIDEAYIGGSETNKHADKKNKTEKTCIIGLVNGDTKTVRVYKVSNNEKDNLLPKIYLNVSDKSNIFTDSHNSYDDLKKHYNHKFVKHCAGEYNRDKKDDSGGMAYKTNTNSIEGFWNQLKRRVYGVYHWLQICIFKDMLMSLRLGIITGYLIILGFFLSQSIVFFKTFFTTHLYPPNFSSFKNLATLVIVVVLEPVFVEISL